MRERGSSMANNARCVWFTESEAGDLPGWAYTKWVTAPDVVADTHEAIERVILWWFEKSEGEFMDEMHKAVLKAVGYE